jgi:hypothetical protein
MVACVTRRTYAAMVFLAALFLFSATAALRQTHAAGAAVFPCQARPQAPRVSNHGVQEE